MKNNELLDVLRSGHSEDISPRSRSEAIAIAIHQKVKGTDVSTDTVTAETLLEGVTAYNSGGKLVKGTHVCKDPSIVITDFSYFCENGERLDVIKHIHTSHGVNFEGMFADCNDTTIPELDTSKGTNFSNMFRNCTTTTSIPQLDTSKGTNFSAMFLDCWRLASVPGLNTGNGTDFSEMFRNCNDLTAIPELDTSKGTNFSDMFSSCSSLTSIPALDTSNGENFGYMFRDCTALKDITFVGTINKGGMDLSWSKSLTKASITSLVNALSSTATGQSVTVSQTAVNNAFTTDEWNALKATKSNWTIELEDS